MKKLWRNSKELKLGWKVFKRIWRDRWRWVIECVQGFGSVWKLKIDTDCLYSSSAGLFFWPCFLDRDNRTSRIISKTCSITSKKLPKLIQRPFSNVRWKWLLLIFNWISIQPWWALEESFLCDWKKWRAILVRSWRHFWKRWVDLESRRKACKVSNLTCNFCIIPFTIESRFFFKRIRDVPRRFLQDLWILHFWADHPCWQARFKPQHSHQDHRFDWNLIIISLSVYLINQELPRCVRVLDSRESDDLGSTIWFFGINQDRNFSASRLDFSIGRNAQPDKSLLWTIKKRVRLEKFS